MSAPLDPDGPEPAWDEGHPHEEYEAAWRLWRALRRDERLTQPEADAQFEVIEQWVVERFTQDQAAAPGRSIRIPTLRRIN